MQSSSHTIEAQHFSRVAYSSVSQKFESPPQGEGPLQSWTQIQSEARL